MRSFCLLLLTTIALFFADLKATASSIVIDSGFESPGDKWSLFIPKENSDGQCYLTISGEAAHKGGKCAVLSATEFSRFGIYPDGRRVSVTGGEKYRFSGWVRGDNNFRTKPGTPGVLLRATLRTHTNADYEQGHLYVGLGGVAIGNPARLAGTEVPKKWTKIEGVFEIPNGVKEVILFVFCHEASGRLFVDDVNLSKVAGSVAVTPILK